MISLIPNLTIIGLYNNYDRGYLLSFFVYWFLLNTLNLIIPSIEFFKLRLCYNFIYSMILISSILIILYTSYKYTGFRFDLNIFNAYVYRAEADSYQLGNFVDYLFSISRNILPVFIIDKLVKKKRIQALILLIVGLLAYSVTGSKSVLFSYFIVYIGYWFYNDDRIAYIPLWMIFYL